MNTMKLNSVTRAPMRRFGIVLVLGVALGGLAPVWARAAQDSGERTASGTPVEKAATKSDTAPAVDHSQMDHGAPPKASTAGDAPKPAMDHGSMQGGDPPPDARDPHAYSGGYGFGPLPRHAMGDEQRYFLFLMDRFEHVRGRDNSEAEYDLQAWYGGDYDRAVLKAEGEVDAGKLREARTELLWSHAVATYWDAQLGLRYDGGEKPGRKWFAFGVQGLAPYWFELDATAYVGESGRTALRFEAEYELLLTQRLILQPRFEANLYGQRDAQRELGSGLSDATLGLRLRYEIRREFAPYIGVERSNKYGGTAEFARADGKPTSEWRWVAGLRFWF